MKCLFCRFVLLSNKLGLFKKTITPHWLDCANDCNGKCGVHPMDIFWGR